MLIWLQQHRRKQLKMEIKTSLWRKGAWGRNIFKNMKVCYKFLNLYLHQSRYKWELNIDGGKKPTGLYLWVGPAELLFQLKWCTDDKEKGKWKNLSLSFSLRRHLITSSYSVYLISKGHPQLVHGEMEFHLCVHRGGHLHDIVLVL